MRFNQTFTFQETLTFNNDQTGATVTHTLMFGAIGFLHDLPGLHTPSIPVHATLRQQNKYLFLGDGDKKEQFLFLFNIEVRPNMYIVVTKLPTDNPNLATVH